MALRKSALNGYCPKGEVLVCVLENELRFEGGEREIDLLVHAHLTNSLFSFLVSFLFFSVFRSCLFSFLLALFFFSFHFVKCAIFFRPLL